MKMSLLSVFALVAILSVGCGPATAPTPTEAPGSSPTVVSNQAPAPQGGTVEISIGGFKFDPATVTTNVGATVTWTNRDSAAHTVTGDDGSWASESLANGATFSHTFDKAGTYTYHCAVHSSMKGNVVVQ